MKIFVLYIPGLDHRRTSSDQTPYIHQLLKDYPSSRIRTLPNTELVPTLLTGTYPHQNHVFQVSFKNELKIPAWHKLLCMVPDSITSLLQCVYYMFDKKYELPTVTWQRRRQFNFHRLKYTRRQKKSETLNIIGGIPSLFQLIGEQSRYIFVKEFEKMHRMMSSLPSADVAFEFLEFYALDLFSHWNLDRAQSIAHALRVVDDLVAIFHENCQQKGVKLLLLVDHGQERIKSTIDLKKLLSSTGVKKEEYLFFLEVSSARLWFKTDRARQKILRVLESVEYITIRDYHQMHQYNICFEDDRFGEVFIFPDHGCIFFPHDFYHPLANIFLALTNYEQRSRLFNPRHRGNHGHLPNHPSEEGYIVFMDRFYETPSETVDLIDFAPTVLDMLDLPKPEFMRGNPIFTPTSLLTSRYEKLK